MAAGVVSFIAHYLTLYSCYASIIAYLARFFCLSPVKPSGDRFKRGAFAFIRADKVGNQAGWKVEKI
jgi:hypothetical protein